MSRIGWEVTGALALLCSTVAWASLPEASEVSIDQERQWQALGLGSLATGGATGMRMAAREAAAPVAFVPQRAVPIDPKPEAMAPRPAASKPVRIRGRVGDGLYWSLRAAGASPQVAAQYLAALATEIDVGEVAVNDGFDLVLGANRQLLYAGLERVAVRDLHLVRWESNGRASWIDATTVDKPSPSLSAPGLPVAGRITSYFGYRKHPILHFSRFHAGLDIGAGWGSPIAAAADGQVVAAGWAGGYGRQVRIAHAGGLVTSYSHMSQIVAQPGSFIRAGQLIGYVGSSGLSTGPHLHYEVKRGGTPVNPLEVHFASAPVLNAQLAGAVKARLKQLLSVGQKNG